MTMTNALRLPVLTALAALAGCQGASDRYPSLAIRDAERVAMTNPDALDIEPPAPVTPLSAEMLSRAKGFGAQVRAAHTRFQRVAESARRPIARARGSAPGSDAWAAGQVARAGLNSARSETAFAFADLEALTIEARTELVELDALNAIHEEAEGLVREEDRIIARLR